MSHEHTNRPDGAAPAAPSSPATSSPVVDGADSFMSSLADLESRIASLKAMHESAAARELSYASRERTLAERESAVTGRAEETERRLKEIEVAKANLDAQQEQSRLEHRRLSAELERKAYEAEERERALRAELDERERGITQRIGELETRQREAEATLAAQRAEIAEALDQAQQARNRAEEHVRRAEQENASRRAKLAELEQEIAARREKAEADLAERERALAARAVKAEAELVRAAAEAEEASKEREAIEQLAAEAQRREQALAQQREHAERERQNAERVLGEQRTALERREQELKEQEFDIQRTRQEIESQRASVAEHARTLAEQMKRSEDENAAAIWSNRMEAIQLELGESNAARARLETELAQRTAEIETLTRELIDSNQKEASPEEIRRRDAEIAELGQRVREASADAARFARRAEEAEERARGGAAERERELAARDTEIAGLKHELVEARRLVEEAGKLAAQQAAAARESAAGDARGEIERREQAIVLLKSKLDEAAAENLTLGERLVRVEQELASVQAAPAAATQTGPTDADVRRRDRLRKYKTLLQTQARKIVAAQTALARRHADCEMVLANRSKLAELARQLAKAEKRITASRARTGAAAAMLYLVATMAILAVMSWEVSKRVWPGTYIARAVLEADAGRRVPKAEDLGAWQKDNQDLLTDPRLIEMAAERMQRRGLASVGTPAELSDRLKKDLYVQQNRPGSMTIELRGEGAERTTLVLDTLVTSFKAASDEARGQRENDIGVVIAQAAAAGAEPLSDKRLERAGGVFGGAALAAGLGMLVIWSRMAKAKRKFDQAAAVEIAMGEVDWSQLEASIKQHGSKAGG